MDALQGSWQLLKQLGGAGLILMGILDSSVLPTMGSQDVLTIILAAGHPDRWLYYAAMATAGSVLGGYFTFRLGRKGGKQALEQRLRGPRLDALYRRFEKLGFGTVFVPALLPPPFPIVPSLLCAGALNYPRSKFLVAFGVGRAARFAALAYLSSILGRRLLVLFQDHTRTLLVALLVMAAVGASAFVLWRRFRKPESRRAA